MVTAASSPVSIPPLAVLLPASMAVVTNSPRSTTPPWSPSQPGGGGQATGRPAPLRLIPANMTNPPARCNQLRGAGDNEIVRQPQRPRRLAPQGPPTGG